MNQWSTGGFATLMALGAITCSTLFGCSQASVAEDPVLSPSELASTPGCPGNPPVPPPGPGGATLASDFARADDQWVNNLGDNGGSITFGKQDDAASDGKALELLFGGDPALGPADRAGPYRHASEVYTASRLHFGTYRARFSLAHCAENETLVNGIFVYANDGSSDINHNGISDNTEIDIEVLCGEPHILYLTSWTDYEVKEEVEHFRKRTRAIDTRTGEIFKSPADDKYGLEPDGSDPSFVIPGFTTPGAYLEMGWEWHASRVRWFIVVDGVERTLWDLKDPDVIPQADAPFMFNLWHARTQWFEGGPADYPASDAALRVDWFRYTKE